MAPRLEPRMRLRNFYLCAILAPLAVFAAVAAVGGDDGASTLGLGPGATVRWLYPRSAIRELVAYAGVALWLLWTLQRRDPADFQRAIWRAPVLLVVIHVLFPLTVILANGVVRTVAAEQGGRILLRLVVRLLVGFGYVGLIERVRRQLLLQGSLIPTSNGPPPPSARDSDVHATVTRDTRSLP